MNDPSEGKSALEINLQRTAAEVVIPEEQRVLLDATAGAVGVHEKTEALLKEVNHPFASWPVILPELRTYAFGNFFYHNSHDRGAEAIEVIVSIFLKISAETDDPGLRIDGLRTLLRYLESAVEQSETTLDRNRPVLESALRRACEECSDEDGEAATLSGSVRRLIATMTDASSNWDMDGLRDLLHNSLERTYHLWLSLPDPLSWDDPSAAQPTQSLRRISHESFQTALEELGKGGDDLAHLVSATSRLPDQGAIEKLYLEAADEIGRRSSEREAQIAKVLFLLKVLDTVALRRIHDTALRAINRSVSKALGGGNLPDADRFVDVLFEHFGKGWMQHDVTVLDCIHTIAEDVIRSGDDALIQKVISRILEHGFELPEVSGVNELWQYEVNPAHIRNIRSWLELISINPPRTKRLLAALIVHLESGGVHVSDTDLLQKDMAALLNADISTVYSLVKQLGRLLPVYFSEIGAEGEIRVVSTKLDELCKRGDQLGHFLRKQCHVESSSRLLPFLEATFKYWATGDKGPLRPYLPPEVFSHIDTGDEYFREMHVIFGALAKGAGVFPDDFLAHDHDHAEAMIDAVKSASKRAMKKAQYAARLYFLLDEKYNFSARGAVEEVKRSSIVDRSSVILLENALDGGNHLQAIELIVPILEDLKEVILDPDVADSREDIYHKRHIAAGIPSMYGRFINRKLEALGLSYRLESLGKSLFEELIERENLRYMTKRGIRRILQWIVLFRRALEIDGIATQELTSRHDMLLSGLRLGHLTIDQFINIFQFTSRTIHEMIQEQIVSAFEADMDLVVHVHIPPEEQTTIAGREKAHMFFESFLRDQISSCFGLQSLDNLIERILHTLQYEAENFSKSTRNLLMSYDIERCFAPIFGREVEHNDPIFFGHKGFGLRRMADLEYPVPSGFIITTEVYRCYQALKEFDELRDHGIEVLKTYIAELERQTGRRFGDPKNPLLLSVRSGSAISMPGILDTFLNVGINEEIAEGLSKRPRFAWAAWDNYRRFLQCWGLSYGVPQDTFDDIFESGKRDAGITHKRFFTAEQIRDVALACRKAIIDHGVRVLDDPFDQLRYCIDRVLDSWDGDRAKVYRRAMNIANDWGTAVVVQSMIYGNLDERSGTGVLFTRNPRIKSADVSLYGDFVLRSQGEDVVRGLVETFPISEEQREIDGAGGISLEAEFPEVYHELLRISTDLVIAHGLNHQEIEFTFEDRTAESLSILQAREVITPEESIISSFVPTESLDKNYAASGIGVGGGALSGRVAHNEEEIDRIRREHPGDRVILVRPNTVPEDMHLIFLSDGLLTSRGGCTSHAAVAAQRIGRTCVVGCRSLQVEERAGESEIHGHKIRGGDHLSINGFDGSVYLGEHEIQLTRRLAGI